MRERRTKVIHAEGEKQAAQALMEAAEILSRQPAAMQLRDLQTLTRGAGDKSSTLAGLSGSGGFNRQSDGGREGKIGSKGEALKRVILFSRSSRC